MLTMAFGEREQSLSKGELEVKLENMQGRLRSVRQGLENQAKKLEHAAVSSGTAFVMGMVEGRAQVTGSQLPTVLGMDPKLVYSVVGYFGADIVGGRAGEVIQSAAVGVMNSYAYAKGLNSGVDSAHADQQRQQQGQQSGTQQSGTQQQQGSGH